MRKPRFVSRHITKDEWSTECSGDGNYVRSWRCVRAGMQASKRCEAEHQGFWERFAQAGFRSTGSGQLEWRIQWPLMHPDLDPGSVTELLMTLGAEIIVALL